MDPSSHPLLVRSGSTYSNNKRLTAKASSRKVVVDSDENDPLSGARVEVDLEMVRKKMGSTYADFIPFPPSISLEVEMLHRQLCRERKKNFERNLMMICL